MQSVVLRRPAVLAALLFVLTLALYWRTGTFEFLNYDDDVYVTQNAHVRGGLTWAGARWAFTTGHGANWHPLTWLSHQLDVELFGLEAGAHHRTSAVLHALNAALCFLALCALTGARGKSALVAAFFALHPLRVESVAWVSERKDLLAASCAFGCLWAYASHARRGGRARLGLCLALFALGLLAKPMLVTLPGVLLLLDVWPLQRFFRKPAPGAPVPLPSRAPTHPGEVTGSRVSYGIFLEKLPFLVLAGAAALVTLLVQRSGGAFGSSDAIGLEARLANALSAGGLYVWKTFVPTGLCAFHPHPALAEPPRGPWSPGVLAGLALLLGASALLLVLRQRAPYALVGWLWFLGMLVPVIGIVQVGLQGWAERYTYLPSVGLGLALVWGVDALAGRVRARRATLACGLVVLAALAVVSARQIGVWRDTRTLLAHALEADESDVAHVNLARALEATDLAAAEQHYRRALELRPSLAGARLNLAHVLRAGGRAEEARVELERALASAPGVAALHAELGLLLAELGQDAEGIAHLRRAVALDPTEKQLQNNLAWVLATSRGAAAPAEALAIAEQLCRATGHNQAGFLETLAAALARLGRFDEAVQWQARAVQLVPAQHEARLSAVLALYRAQKPCLKTP